MSEQNIFTELDEREIVKRTIKDSVFSDLFGNKGNLLQLYKRFHPEDTAVSEEDLKDITIENVLVDDIYNDLGVLVKDNFMIFVEAQSTWSYNILIRVILYLSKTYKEYFDRQNIDLYTSAKAKMPKPEIYVVYTGNRKDRPETINLTEHFFDGNKADIDVTAHMIYESDGSDILNQYIIFTKVFDEQRNLFGRTKDAILETIKICKDRNILRDYLTDKEQEVINMMMDLYDQEYIMRSRDNGKAREQAIEMIKDGILTDEKIAQYTKLRLDFIKDLRKEIMQTI